MHETAIRWAQALYGYRERSSIREEERFKVVEEEKYAVGRGLAAYKLGRNLNGYLT